MVVTKALLAVKQCFGGCHIFTYLFGWNLDTNLLDGFGKFIWLNNSIVIEVEVLERLLKDGFLGLSSLGLLTEFVF